MRACMISTWISVLTAATLLTIGPAIAQDVGPCNAAYDFVCDSDGNCTCERQGVIEVISYSIGSAQPFPLANGDRLEIVPADSAIRSSGGPIVEEGTAD